MEGQPLSFSSSAPPPPHKFPGATSVLLPGPGAPCALNWKKKKKKASSKQRAAGSSPAPGLWARPRRRPVCVRGAHRSLPERQEARGPVDGCGQDSGNHHSRLLILRYIQPGCCGLVSTGGGGRLARRWWNWHQVPRGCPGRAPPAQLPVSSRTPTGARWAGKSPLSEDGTRSHWTWGGCLCGCHTMLSRGEWGRSGLP